MTRTGLSPLANFQPPALLSREQQKWVAFGHGAGGQSDSVSFTHRASRPTGAATNPFIFGGFELLLIPIALIGLAGSGFWFFKNVMLRFAELPMKLAYGVGKQLLGPKIPSLYSLPKWGFWDLMPDFRKHL